MRITIGEEFNTLLEVYVNDFGDNYHRTDNEPSTELEKASRKIRRRYKNIGDYMMALGTYQEYMALLALKHGGPQLFKIKLKEELINDFIPPKPRMKNTAHNKLLMKKKIMISRANVNQIDEEKLYETLQAMDEDFHGDDAIVTDTETKDHIANRIMKDEDLTKVNIRKVGQISSIDFLEEYFHNKNKVKSREKEEETKAVSLTMLASDKYHELVKDTEEEDDIVFYRGNYMNKQTVEDLKVYQQLGEFGWDSIKLMKQKGVSKRVTNIVKNQNKMNKKKNKKGKKKQQQSDAFLVQVMTDNDHDTFAAYEQDMLNFTSENVFGR